MLSKVETAAVRGIEGIPVTVETEISNGIPYFVIVGLVDRTVRESRDRVREAIVHSKCKYPNRKITINLSPGDVQKRGSHFDMPIAVSILQSSGQLPTDCAENSAFIGELSFDGSVKPVKGVLPMIKMLTKIGIENIFIPFDNRLEASFSPDAVIHGVKHINELISHLKNEKLMPPLGTFTPKPRKNESRLDFSEVMGQETAKRAIAIATAGGHGILMKGSPSSGKTMLSQRIPTILPPMSYEEIVETTLIYSVAGYLDGALEFALTRPFRNPHHTITKVGMLGGGFPPLPGEISLAHHGVLFLDEICEFNRDVIDSLRLPLEDKQVTIVRRGESITFPANFMLVAASNNCKCGYAGDPHKPCTCSPAEIDSYFKKISGPIMERIDMNITIPPVEYGDFKFPKRLSSADMRSIIENCRKIQKKRFGDDSTKLNGQMNEGELKIHCKLSNDAEDILKKAYENHMLNPRTYNKTLKVARTIADINENEGIEAEHVAESLQYRGNG